MTGPVEAFDVVIILVHLTPHRGHSQVSAGTRRNEIVVRFSNAQRPICPHRFSVLTHSG